MRTFCRLFGDVGPERKIRPVHDPDIRRFQTLEPGGHVGLALPFGERFEEGLFVLELDPQAVIDDGIAVGLEGFGPELFKQILEGIALC